MNKKRVKPPIYKSGHVLFITDGFPPRVGGSSVLNYNLLTYFDEKSFTVITRYSLGANKLKRENRMSVIRLFAQISRLGKLNDWLFRLQIPLAKIRIKILAKKNESKLIIGTYPNLNVIDLAMRVANDLKLPFVSYLHDTVFEGNIGTRLEAHARKLSEKIFNQSRLVFVMSDGMAELYLKKNEVETIPLRHTYSEKIFEATIQKNSPKRFFWGGAIYKINIVTISNISNCLTGHNIVLELATNTSETRLEQSGFNLENCDLTFYRDRDEYIKAIQNCDALLLGLDDQMDTTTHVDEIGTVFPTKVPEYLASGKPILVICPPDYFLARYFTKHDCGFVYQKEDLKDFDKILRDLSNQDLVGEKVKNAQKMLDMHFRGEEVVKVMSDNLKNI